LLDSALLMQNELSLLIQLQDHDAHIDGLHEKAEELMPLIKAKNQKAESLKSALKVSKDKIQTQQLKRKEMEAEADGKEKQLQKFQAELNSLKSNDTYKAMLGEIEKTKQALRKIEDDILSVMEAVEKEEKEYKEKEKQVKAEEARIQAEITDLETQKEKILAEAKTRLEERNTFAQTVPAPLKDQYEAIREKRGGLAIVPMVNNACGGCRMNLTPNKANEVKKAKTMLLCENCSRILYLPQPDSSAAPSSPPIVSAPSN